MQALSRREETAVLEQAKKDGLKVCDEYVRDFAACSQNRTFSMAWACRSQMTAWTKCMQNYVTEDRLDEMTLDYMANRSEKERQAIEQLKKDRIESYKRHAGIKDESKPSTPR